MENKMDLNWFGEPAQIAVERALGEFRAGRPVAIRSSGARCLAFAAEGLTGVQMQFLAAPERDARLIIPGEMARLRAGWEAPVAAVRLDPLTLEAINAFTGGHHHDGGNGALGSHVTLSKAAEAEAAALALANLSHLLPAAVVTGTSVPALQHLPLIQLEAGSIFEFRDREARSLQIIARTSVPLEGAGLCEFVVFRGGDGFRDQIAVIVGDPPANRPVLARIHSACLTGDLFGSLKCDCGDQLRGTVRAMSDFGGGIVLYLDQEGRGNGIANKIRAYGLQEEGFDTYAADELLGFGHDQRRFDFAAEMLKQLGFFAVRLMTNNPNKIAALRDAGLEVVSTHRVLTRPTAHNVKYLAAKRDKGGHLLGDTALDGIDFEDAAFRQSEPQP